MLTPMARVEAELSEAFAPAQSWRWADPIERTNDLYLEALSTITTLMHWGWSVTAHHTATGWQVSASRTVEGRSVKARGSNRFLPDALGILGEKLEAELRRVTRIKTPRRSRMEEAA
ncbi:MAG: hypothetical protein WBA46_19245 [Thermomicrobiales bacterium]